MTKKSLALILIGAMLVAAFSAVSGQAYAGAGKNSQTPVETVQDVSPAEESPLENAEWTIMVYLDGDNNLETYAIEDLSEMEAIGSKSGVNVIVLMDTHTLLEGTHWYFLGEGVDHVDLAAGLHDCDCDEIAGGCPGELNMGDGATLTEFVRTAANFAPAKHYMLVLWDHGGGWYGVCWDETDLMPDGRADRLTVDETANAVALAGLHLDIIAYDACFMGATEVAYENRNIADWMVASITTVPGAGWDYELFLGGLTAAEGKLSPYETGVLASDAYVESYATCAGAGTAGFAYCAMSVFDLSKIDELVVNVDRLAEALMPHAEDQRYRGVIESSESQTPMIQYSGEAFPFVDLGSFALLMAEKIPEVSDVANDTFESVLEAVPHCNYVKTDTDAPMRIFGISLYFTCSYYYLYEDYGFETYEEAEAAGALPYFGMDIAIDTDWDEFLLEFSIAYAGGEEEV